MRWFCKALNIVQSSNARWDRIVVKFIPMLLFFAYFSAVRCMGLQYSCIPNSVHQPGNRPDIPGCTRLSYTYTETDF